MRKTLRENAKAWGKGDEKIVFVCIIRTAWIFTICSQVNSANEQEKRCKRKYFRFSRRRAKICIDESKHQITGAKKLLKRRTAHKEIVR